MPCSSDRTPRRDVAACFAAVALLLPAAAGAEGVWETARSVSREEVAAAISRQAALGYDLTVPANSVRMQSAVFFELTDAARQTDALGRPLRLGHAEYHDAFVEATGLEPDRLPLWLRKIREFREDHLLDYRRDRVLADPEAPEAPPRALAVKTGWPPAPGAPGSYSYEDLTSRPRFEVTHQQVTAYHLLDLGGTTVLAGIQGITGRATSGFLGLVFDVIGVARAVESRYAIAADGTQVNRTTAHKWFNLHQTVTILADGTVLKNVPSGRPELAALERRLRGELRVELLPIDLDPVPAPPP